MIIKAGTHYARPLQLFKKLLGIRFCREREIECAVRFFTNCKYNIGIDQSDINKLFGYSFGLHHKNSLRVGWRYVTKKDMIEIVTYIYVKGERIQEKHIAWCNFGRYYYITLGNTLNCAYFKVSTCFRDCSLITTNFSIARRMLSYPLSLYFGGNCVAPHDMNIYYKVYYDETRCR